MVTGKFMMFKRDFFGKALNFAVMFFPAANRNRFFCDLVCGHDNGVDSNTGHKQQPVRDDYACAN